MRYEGPIYRPPSEADSLLIQATIGCPHNRCTFCMVYKNGPKYRVRPVDDVKKDILEASQNYGSHVRTLFLPAGNTIAMKTEDLAEICRFASPRSSFTRRCKNGLSNWQGPDLGGFMLDSNQAMMSH